MDPASAVRPSDRALLATHAVERRAVEAAIWGMPIVSVDALGRVYTALGKRWISAFRFYSPEPAMHDKTWTMAIERQ